MLEHEENGNRKFRVDYLKEQAFSYLNAIFRNEMGDDLSISLNFF